MLLTLCLSVQDEPGSKLPVVLHLEFGRVGVGQQERCHPQYWIAPGVVAAARLSDRVRGVGLVRVAEGNAGSGSRTIVMLQAAGER